MRKIIAIGLIFLSSPLFAASVNLNVTGGLSATDNITVNDATVTDDLVVGSSSNDGTITIDGTTSGNSILYFGDGGTAKNQVYQSNGTEILTFIGAGGFRFNESGLNIDYVIESDTLDPALHLEGSNGFLGLNTGSPATRLANSDTNYTVNSIGVGTNSILWRCNEAGYCAVISNDASGGSVNQGGLVVNIAGTTENAAPDKNAVFAALSGDVMRFMVSAAGNVGINNIAPSGKFIVTVTSTQTIAAGNTIAADACGSIKRITAAGGVTTDTTNTFTAPSAANEGCIMHIVNVGSNSIVLDNNANFKSAGAADVTLGADDAVTVGSIGSVWYQLTAVVTN